jgi:hypothetical protein
MECGTNNNWYLLKDDDTFAIQYTGPDPEKHFAVDMKGIEYNRRTISNVVDDELLETIESLWSKEVRLNPMEPDDAHQTSTIPDVSSATNANASEAHSLTANSRELLPRDPNANINSSIVSIQTSSESANSFQEMRECLGDGRPQLQLYWYYIFHNVIFIQSVFCAAAMGILYPNPASHTYFNNHPSNQCYVNHPQHISTVFGCSIHNGVRDLTGDCAWCSSEKATGQFYNSIPLHHKIGYRP